MKKIELHIQTLKRTEFIDITQMIDRVISDNNVQDGIAVIFTPHTTAGITINENADPDVKRDLDYKINAMIPENDGRYYHMEGNSDSHMKSSLFGPSLTLIVENGRLVLGTWQSVYFCEFDGPRHRKVYVKLISD